MEQYQRSAVIAFAALFSFCSAATAQLPKPTIDTVGVGWGWFDLRMTGNSVTPSNTEWVMLDGVDTVMDTWRKWDGDNATQPGPHSRIPDTFVADKRDLISKHVVGSIPERTYTARVRYNNGSVWSPFSDALSFTTPAEPVRGGDTIFIVLWGHSLARYTGLYNVLTTFPDFATDGFDPRGDHDAFGHALQTQLRRITGRTVTVVNASVSGSLQYDWLRPGPNSPDANIGFYDPGKPFANTSRYGIALFFFGQTDARDPFCDVMNHPPGQYSVDADTIIQRLTRKGIRVVYNSIHYATATDCPNQSLGWEGAQRDRQDAYYRSWDSLMKALVPRNPLLWRGLDLYTLFKSDTVRYQCPDGIHLNNSEGVQGLVEPLARTIDSVIANLRQTVGVSDRNVVPARRPGLSIMPNPSHTVLHLRITVPEPGNVRLEAFSPLGNSAAVLLDAEMPSGNRDVAVDCSGLSTGHYLLRLQTSAGMATQTIEIAP